MDILFHVFWKFNQTMQTILVMVYFIPARIYFSNNSVAIIKTINVFKDKLSISTLVNINFVLTYYQ
jgi:hypothetical protein